MGNGVVSFCFVFNLRSTLLCLNGIREVTGELTARHTPWQHIRFKDIPTQRSVNVLSLLIPPASLPGPQPSPYSTFPPTAVSGSPV